MAAGQGKEGATGGSEATLGLLESYRRRPSHTKTSKNQATPLVTYHNTEQHQNPLGHSLQATRPIMLLPHVPHAVVTPSKALRTILAILILAHKPVIRFGGAVTTRHMTVLILLPVESLGRATGEVTFERTAVGLEVFTARPLALSRGKRDCNDWSYLSSHRRSKVFKKHSGHRSGSMGFDEAPLDFLLRCGGSGPWASELGG